MVELGVVKGDPAFVSLRVAFFFSISATFNHSDAIKGSDVGEQEVDDVGLVEDCVDIAELDGEVVEGAEKEEDLRFVVGGCCVCICVRLGCAMARLLTVLCT